jgi:hypothetical protein
LKRIGAESLYAIQQLQLRYLEDFELELNGNVSVVRLLEAVELSSMKKFKLSSRDWELSNESILRLAQLFPKLQEISFNEVKISNFNVILDNFRELARITYDILSEEEFYMPRFEPGNVYSKLKEISINFLYDYGQ